MSRKGWVLQQGRLGEGSRRTDSGDSDISGHTITSLHNGQTHDLLSDTHKPEAYPGTFPPLPGATSSDGSQTSINKPTFTGSLVHLPMVPGALRPNSASAGDNLHPKPETPPRASSAPNTRRGGWGVAESEDQVHTPVEAGDNVLVANGAGGSPFSKPPSLRRLGFIPQKGAGSAGLFGGSSEAGGSPSGSPLGASTPKVERRLDSLSKTPASPVLPFGEGGSQAREILRGVTQRVSWRRKALLRDGKNSGKVDLEAAIGTTTTLDTDQGRAEEEVERVRAVFERHKGHEDLAWLDGDGDGEVVRRWYFNFRDEDPTLDPVSEGDIVALGGNSDILVTLQEAHASRTTHVDVDGWRRLAATTAAKVPAIVVPASPSSTFDRSIADAAADDVEREDEEKEAKYLETIRQLELDLAGTQEQLQVFIARGREVDQSVLNESDLRLGQDSEEIERLKEKIKALEAQIAALNRKHQLEMDALKAKKEVEMDALKAEHNREIAAKNKAVAAAKDDLATAQAALTALEEGNEELLTAQDAATKALAALRVEMATQAGTFTQRMMDLEAAKQKAEVELTQAVEDHATKEKALTDELDEAKDAAEASKKMTSVGSGPTSPVRTLQEELGHKALLDDLRGKLAASQVEIARLNGLVAAADAAAAAARAAEEARASAAARDRLPSTPKAKDAFSTGHNLIELQAELERIRRELSVATAKNRELEADNVRLNPRADRVDELEQERAAIDAARAKLEAEHAKAITAMQAKMQKAQQAQAALEAEKGRVRDALKVLVKQVKAFEGIVFSPAEYGSIPKITGSEGSEAILGALKGRVGRLQEKYAELGEALQTARAENVTLAGDRNKIAAELAALQDRLAQVEADNRAKQQRLDDQGQELARRQREIDKLTDALAASATQIATANGDVATKARELAALKSAQTEALATAAAATASTDEGRTALADLQQDHATALAAKDQELDALRGQVAVLNAQVAALTQEKAALAAQLVQDLAAHNDANAALQADLVAARAQIAALAARVQQAEQDLAQEREAATTAAATAATAAAAATTAADAQILGDGDAAALPSDAGNQQALQQVAAAVAALNAVSDLEAQLRDAQALSEQQAAEILALKAAADQAAREQAAIDQAARDQAAAAQAARDQAAREQADREAAAAQAATELAEANQILINRAAVAEAGVLALQAQLSAALAANALGAGGAAGGEDAGIGVGIDDGQLADLQQQLAAALAELEGLRTQPAGFHALIIEREREAQGLRDQIAAWEAPAPPTPPKKGLGRRIVNVVTLGRFGKDAAAPLPDTSGKDALEAQLAVAMQELEALKAAVGIGASVQDRLKKMWERLGTLGEENIVDDYRRRLTVVETTYYITEDPDVEDEKNGFSLSVVGADGSSLTALSGAELVSGISALDAGINEGLASLFDGLRERNEFLAARVVQLEADLAVATAAATAALHHSASGGALGEGLDHSGGFPYDGESDDESSHLGGDDGDKSGPALSTVVDPRRAELPITGAGPSWPPPNDETTPHASHTVPVRPLGGGSGGYSDDDEPHEKPAVASTFLDGVAEIFYRNTTTQQLRVGGKFSGPFAEQGDADKERSRRNVAKLALSAMNKVYSYQIDPATGGITNLSVDYSKNILSRDRVKSMWNSADPVTLFLTIPKGGDYADAEVSYDKVNEIFGKLYNNPEYKFVSKDGIVNPVLATDSRFDLLREIVAAAKTYGETKDLKAFRGAIYGPVKTDLTALIKRHDDSILGYNELKALAALLMAQSHASEKSITAEDQELVSEAITFASVEYNERHKLLDNQDIVNFFDRSLQGEGGIGSKYQVLKEYLEREVEKRPVKSLRPSSATSSIASSPLDGGGRGRGGRGGGGDEY